MIFKLESTELEAAEEFKKVQTEKDDRMPTAGERWTYSFTPTGLGTTVGIKDNITGDTKDITEWDWWE